MNDVIDRSRGFSQVPHDVIKAVSDGNAIALYAILKMYAGANGDAHPSRKKLAAHLGYSTVKMVDKAIESLRSRGLLETFPRYVNTERKVSLEQSEEFNVRTSNGYIIYDTPYPIGEGVGPYRGQGVMPYRERGVGPYRGQEVDTPEVDTSEVDPPVVPQRGTGAGVEVAALVTEPAAASSGYPPAFEAWWADYPKKTGKGDAFRKWKAANKKLSADELHARLLDRLPGLLATQQRNPRFVPNPATWLNQARYDDPVEEPQQPVSQQDQRRMKLIAAAHQITQNQEMNHDQRELG